MQNSISEIRREYIKRINNVINFIEANLDKELHLDGLSQMAFFSPFHFHRVFSAIVGETLNTYIVRKRIERIASVLSVGTHETLIELAYKYGFSSGSSFARAFKKFYGISPTEFKKKGNETFSKNGIGLVTDDKYFCNITKILRWIKMNAQIEVKKLPEIKLAGIMHIGEPGKIFITYEKLFRWASINRVFNSPHVKAVTIYHDNPKVTEISKVRQSACIIIDKDVNPEGEIVNMIIRGGNYAVGRFEISSNLFQKAWDSMCIWVIESGLSFRDGDYFEIYHNDYRTHPERKFIVDICIPVNPLNKTQAHSGKCYANKSLNNYKEEYKRQIENGEIQKAYQGLTGYIKSLRRYLMKNYPDGFVTGSIYPGDMNITYFPFTPIELKKQKLKVAIVFNHKKVRFEIWLAGQNKQIQKKFWEIFKGSDWDKYHIPSTIDNGFSIADSILTENPDFNNLETLTEQIEARTIKFIQDIKEALDM